MCYGKGGDFLKKPLLNLIKNAPDRIKTNFVRKNYREGAQILDPGVPPGFLYIIEKGRTEVYKESYDGSIVSVNTFNAGSFFGEIELFCPDLKPYNVRAKTNCTLILIRQEDVFAWMREDFSFTFFFCELLTRRLHFTSNSMSRMALLSLKERVLGFIQAQDEAGTLDTLTKKMLISQVRAPLRSVNRILRDCIKEGIIDYRNKTFYLIDRDAVSKYAKKYEI